MRTILFFTISILISVTSFSQNKNNQQQPDVLNEGGANLSPLEQAIKEQGGGVFRKDNDKNRVMRGINENDVYETTYPHVREADVMWSTTIWREIDLRHKMNQPLYFPAKITPSPSREGYKGYADETFLLADRRSLIDVLFSAIINGDKRRVPPLPPLPCYDPSPEKLAAKYDDEFKERLTVGEIKKIAMGRMDSVLVEDTITDTQEWELQYEGFDRTLVTKYWVKEEWFFDKQRSVMDVRIIGVCPVVESFDDNERFDGYEPLFWLYFPEARPYLAGWEVFNHQNNNSGRMTYDDLFMMRYFNSTIFKESNPYDRQIADYKTGLDALLESETIKNKIFNLELDLWEY